MVEKHKLKGSYERRMEASARLHSRHLALVYEQFYLFVYTIVVWFKKWSMILCLMN